MESRSSDEAFVCVQKLGAQVASTVCRPRNTPPESEFLIHERHSPALSSASAFPAARSASYGASYGALANRSHDVTTALHEVAYQVTSTLLHRTRRQSRLFSLIEG